MRFAIDAKPVPPRRFRLPEGERSTAPAPLPEDKPVTAPKWGAGTPRETYRRPVQPVKAQAPKRRVQAQMVAARGLYTVSAPIGPRKGRTVLDFVAATDAPMQAFMGTLAL